ncbi:MAG: DciA family protein [Woeseiaceae bacterium]
MLLNSGDNSSLEKIIQRAQNMDSLTSRIRSGIAPELAENLVAATINDRQELVLLCSSSAWASRLRFEAETILLQVRESGERVAHCVVKVSR